MSKGTLLVSILFVVLVVSLGAICFKLFHNDGYLDIETPQATVHLPDRTVGEMFRGSIVLFNSSWFVKKEILSVIPDCGCLKIEPQNFLIGRLAKSNLTFSVKGAPSISTQRFTSVISWRYVGSSKINHSIVYFEVNNVDLIKLTPDSLVIKIPPGQSQLPSQVIAFERGKSPISWDTFVVEKSPLFETSVFWSDHNSGLIKLTPISDNLHSINDTASVAVVLKLLGSQHANLIAKRYINVEFVRDTDIQIVPTTAYFGRVSASGEEKNILTLTISEKNKDVKCLRLEADNPAVKADCEVGRHQLYIHVSLIGPFTKKMLSGYINATLDDGTVHRVDIPYYAILIH